MQYLLIWKLATDLLLQLSKTDDCSLKMHLLYRELQAKVHCLNYYLPPRQRNDSDKSANINCNYLS